MFYRPEDGHGLPRDPFNYLVVPRPIGWVSTRSADGVDNLAPYSFFNAVAYSPPQVMFAATTGHQQGGGLKDSVANAQEMGEFVVNLATWDLREQMNGSSTSAPRDVDEFDIVGLTKAASTIVTPPRVAESPVHLECRTTQVLTLPCDDEEDDNTVVFGQVVGIHIDERVLTQGHVDVAKLRPIGRLGALDYVDVREAFEIKRPVWTEK